MPPVKLDILPLPDLREIDDRVWFTIKLDQKMKWQPDKWQDPARDEDIQAVLAGTDLGSDDDRVKRLSEITCRSEYEAVPADGGSRRTTKGSIGIRADAALSATRRCAQNDRKQWESTIRQALASARDKWPDNQSDALNLVAADSSGEITEWTHLFPAFIDYLNALEKKNQAPFDCLGDTSSWP